ncbi:MAG: gliding motility protein RemB [Bacteroidota bacterium]
MKKLLFVLSLIFTFTQLSAQIERSPVYPGCENIDVSKTEDCFFSSIEKEILQNYNVPQNVIDDNYKGQIKIIFQVTQEGKLEVIYTHSMYKELEEEAKRVFGNLSKVSPATYDGRPINKRYVFPLNIPITPYSEKEVTQSIVPAEETEITITEEKSIVDEDTLFPEYNSELNIAFTHQEYDQLSYALGLGENTHTASKPYLYNEVKPYIDLNRKTTALLKDKKTWAGRKLFNEHLFLVRGKNYWFTADALMDFQIGKDDSDIDYTFNNTRAVRVQGALGKKLSFSTSFYESQGRFAEYVNKETRRLNPIIGASAVVPGRGKSKSFKDGGFDYPVAEAYLSYTPNEFFNFQFGNGKNFIGDGYRSFFLSDVASPYPFFKVSTQFWKIKYTNLWMWMDDIRRVSSDDNTNLRKFVAMHHLSWNITDKFNLGFFESVITNENSYNSFDISFFNPIIFYRAVEFSNGGDHSGNVQIGLNMKYKLNDNISLYNQFLIDEMTVSEVFGGNGYWGNKFALQFGAKYYNAFKIDNLMLQGEFNWARPYTFSHGTVELNSGHYNQPISHLWGANFWEAIGIARYTKNRWFANAKLIVGEKGFDFDNFDMTTYGGDIYQSYNDRPSDTNNEVAQGNTTNILIGDLQAGWVLNPATNLQLFGGFTYRYADPLSSGNTISEDNTTWFTVGVKSNLFNWYFDF